MNYRTQPTSVSVLKDILARNPRASLQDIRRSHPVFHRMSPDHLGLRLSQAIDDERAGRLK